MTTPAPHRWSVASVRLATLVLPPGSVRRRYRQELAAELWGMSSRQQLTHSLSVLASAPRLHRALVESVELDVPHSPLWCRLHLHHQWHTEVTTDGQAFRRCLACGTDDDETTRRRVPGSMLNAHGVVQY
jgi:hypothetical protein